MSVYGAVSIVCMAAVCCYQSAVRAGDTNRGRLQTPEAPLQLVSTKPFALLVQDFPRYVISYQESPNEIIRHRIRRASTDVSATSREGRFLFKSGFKQLQNLILWTSFLANTVGSGTISTTNSFNLFGKTVNSAVSIAYGDRLFIPPAIPPPFPPIPPIIPPISPIVNPFPPVLPVLPLPPLPGVPFIRPVTTTAIDRPLLLPVTASAGTITPPIAASVKKGNVIITKGNGQTNETKRQQMLEEYVELEKKKNQKLLSEYNDIIKEQQKIATNQNEQWKEFLKQHNLMVDKFNDRPYANIPRFNEL